MVKGLSKPEINSAASSYAMMRVNTESLGQNDKYAKLFSGADIYQAYREGIMYALKCITSDLNNH